jgi:hypothetical protein
MFPLLAVAASKASMSIGASSSSRRALSQGILCLLRLLPAIEHAKHDTSIAIDPVINGLWESLGEHSVVLKNPDVNAGMKL